MKIYLSDSFSNVMVQQPKEELSTFIEYIDKLVGKIKTEVLSMDEVVLLYKEDKRKVYAYSIPGDYYIVFTFSKKNDLLIIDRIQLNNGEVESLILNESSSK